MTAQKITVADIERYDGKKVHVPSNMKLDAAIKLLQRRRDYEETTMEVRETFPVSPLDGAHALFHVIKDIFGFAESVGIPGMFGDDPPRLLSVPVDVDKKVSVPWGRLQLPNGVGWMQTNGTKVDGRIVFEIVGMCRRKNETLFREILDAVGNYLKTGSIYRGKALAVRFYDEDGDLLPMPEPEFMDTKVNEGDLTFSEATADAINTNLFTPISRIRDLKANGIPLKRGVLLGGPYGTGKTMTAKVASKFAVQQGLTFLYCRRPNELAETIQFAKLYCDPAVVVFCEDIDSVTHGSRDHQMNDILNIIDGVDTKNMNLITLLTTNHIEDISKAMLRPGRLDAVIEIPPPDAKAVEKLIRIYGGDVIPPNADLSEVGKELTGAIPAVVAEVVRRAKLHQLALQAEGTAVTEISPQALLASALTIREQRELLGISAGAKRLGSAKTGAVKVSSTS